MTPKPSTRPKFLVNARDFSLDLGTKTRVMGIINITPDSFSGDGMLSRAPGTPGPRDPGEPKNFKKITAKAVHLAEKMIADGADIIDIGGESTRPGSKRISVEEEKLRIIPTITQLAKLMKIPISVDTYKSGVAQAALDAGASIINNIKGVRCDKALLKRIARYEGGVVLMHIQGTPRTMQRHILYRLDVVTEIIRALRNSIENCLEIGIKSDKIIIDPGIGFGKTVAQNLEILKRLREFQALRQPILVGTSRKSFIGRTLNREADDRLLGTLATVTASIMNGAHIVRVHDVRAAVETARMTDAILNQGIA